MGLHKVTEYDLTNFRTTVGTSICQASPYRHASGTKKLGYRLVYHLLSLLPALTSTLLRLWYKPFGWKTADVLAASPSKGASNMQTTQQIRFWRTRWVVSLLV